MHILTDYFKLKIGTIRRERRKVVEVIAIKDDFVHFEAHICGNPGCHKIHNRLLEVGLVKVKLLKKHKTPLEFYEDVFNTFTKKINQKFKFKVKRDYIHDFSRYHPTGKKLKNIHHFFKGEIYDLYSIEEDHIFVIDKNNQVISIRKDSIESFLVKI